MGSLFAYSSLIRLLLGPVAGTFADRRSRKWIILLSDFLNGIVVVLFSLAVFYRPNDIKFLVILLFVLTSISSLAGSFFNPAISASIPDLVPRDKLTAANSLGQFSTRISQFIGSALGGTLYTIVGAPILFLINGLSFIFSAFSELFIDIPQRLPVKNSHTLQTVSFKSDLIEGFRYIWRNRGLKTTVMISAGLSFFTMPIITLLPFFVKLFLHAGDQWFGYLSATYGIGALIGFLLAPILRLNKVVRGRLLLVLIILEGAFFGVFGALRGPLSALFLVLVLGTVDGYINVNIMTILQISTPSEMRGRVFGVLATLGGSLAPLSMAFSGVLADLLHHNIPLIYYGCSIAMVVFALSVTILKEYRNFLVYDDSVPADINQTDTIS